MAEISVTALGSGAYRVSDGRRSRLAYAAGPPDNRWVFLEGRVYVIDVAARPGTAKTRRRDDAAGLAAPMPATVLRINVEPGARVAKGDVLIVLEAMKMELPITASRDAAVKAIACRAGELVQPGIPLLELE